MSDLSKILIAVVLAFAIPLAFIFLLRRAASSPIARFLLRIVLVVTGVLGIGIFGYTFLLDPGGNLVGHFLRIGIGPDVISALLVSVLMVFLGLAMPRLASRPRPKISDILIGLRHALDWFSRRSVFVIAVLLLAIFVLLIWFLIIGSPQIDIRVSLGIAALSAFLAAISAIANLLSAVEVQKQRQSYERPYVVFHLDGASDGMIYALVENYGNSPAQHVVLQFEPVPFDFQGRPLTEVSLFKNPISFMPPGKTFRQAIDIGYRFLAEGKPTVFVLSVSYSSVHNERFNEIQSFDLAYLKQATRPQKSVEEQLETISGEIRKLVTVFEGVRGANSLLIESPDQYRSRLENERGQTNHVVRWKRVIRSFLLFFLSKTS